jgi:amidase
VSANFCTVAIGTETTGSIINPSSENGIVGLKPTIGLVSREGIIPVSLMQDTAGPMGRTVEDVAVLLGNIVGYDKKDPITLSGNYNEFSDYTQFLNKKGLTGMRLGIPREFFYDSLSEEENSIMDSMIKIMKQQGAVIVENIILANAKDLQAKHYILYEFKSEINAFLTRHRSYLPFSTLSELMDYHNAHADIMLKYGQAFMITSDKTSGTLTEPEYLKHRMKELMQSRESVDQSISEYNLDALIFPSDKGVKLIDKAGYPSITVPAGLLKDGQPFGITFSAGAFSEPKLLGMAYSLEQATNKRTPPNI